MHDDQSGNGETEGKAADAGTSQAGRRFDEPGALEADSSEARRNSSGNAAGLPR
jgi:hypothetical protein